MDSVEPIRQPLDRRPGVRAIGEPQILCHPLPVADLPGGVGVMMDDVLAGIYANLLLQIGLKLTLF